MHQELFSSLRLKTYSLQFYSRLVKGNFSQSENVEIEDLLSVNIERLNLMISLEWDGQYDLVVNQIFKTDVLINNTKEQLPFKQICKDDVIANYIENNFDDFFNYGIQLKDLKNILDISVLFRNGYMLHDVFDGYVEQHLYILQVDCIDFVNSAAYFYNEGYDYYMNKKLIHKPEINYKRFEDKRIQQEHEIMFRCFREAYINMIFFVESFINSVGFDAYLGGNSFSEVEQNQLKGIERIKVGNNFKSYSNLSQKIKNISKILNTQPIDVKEEPFKSYLQNNVELRNQYVHSSPEKGRIRLTIEDWKNKCDKMIQDECMIFLLAFWNGCYPNKSFPKIIFNSFCGNSFKGHQGKFVIEELL